MIPRKSSWSPENVTIVEAKKGKPGTDEPVSKGFPAVQIKEARPIIPATIPTKLATLSGRVL